MVDHVEQVYGRADLHPFADVEWAREARVPNIGRCSSSCVATNSWRTIFEVAIPIVVAAGSDVERTAALQRQDVGGLETPGQVNDSTQHEAMTCITKSWSLIGKDVVTVLRDAGFEDVVGEANRLRQGVRKLELNAAVQVLSRAYL